MADINKQKRAQRSLRRGRVRSVISGVSDRPRLSIFRSGKNIYAQLIDDNAGKTLLSASSKEIKNAGKKTDVALEVGKLIAKKAVEKNITKVVFDRGGYKYHGRVKALADGAREGGMQF